MKRKITLTQVLLGLVLLLIGVEVLAFCTRKEEPVKERALTMSICDNDTIVFDITNVISVESAYDDFGKYTITGYKISYATSDSTYVELYTSTMEGDYLIYSLDCLAIYEDYKDEEEIDILRSYFIGNSHISYLENPWFTGFTWTWDAGPLYRYPHP